MAHLDRNRDGPMTGAEFWVYVLVVALLVTAFVRVFVAAWRDHDDDLTAIGTHRWPLKDDD
jgi:hypothetical protein